MLLLTGVGGGIGGGGGIVWTQTFSQSLTGNSTGWLNYNLRQVLNSSLLSTSGTAARLTLTCPVGGCSIDALYIGHQALSGNPYDFDGGQVQVKVGGSGSFSVGSASSVLTDSIAFALDHTKNVVIAMHFNGSSAIGVGSASGATYYYALTANEASATIPSGSYSDNTSSVALIAMIEVH